MMIGKMVTCEKSILLVTIYLHLLYMLECNYCIKAIDASV